MRAGGTYPQVSDCQGKILSKHQLEEHLVERQVDNARIQESFRDELTNDSEYVGPFAR